MVRDLYLSALAACSFLGALRAGLMLATVAMEPALAVRVNPWGVPYWAPSVAAVGLGAFAILMATRRPVLWQALGALWGAGAWALATPVLGGPWWILFPVALPLAAGPVIQEVRFGAHRLGMLATALLSLAALGSLARSPQAVAVAACIVYTASIAGPGWLAWWAYRRST